MADTRRANFNRLKRFADWGELNLTTFKIVFKDWERPAHDTWHRRRWGMVRPGPRISDVTQVPSDIIDRPFEPSASRVCRCRWCDSSFDTKHHRWLLLEVNEAACVPDSLEVRNPCIISWPIPPKAFWWIAYRESKGVIILMCGQLYFRKQYATQAPGAFSTRVERSRSAVKKPNAQDFGGITKLPSQNGLIGFFPT